MGFSAKGPPNLWEVISNPETAFSGEVTDSATHRAWGLDVPMWVWYEQQGQDHERKFFEKALAAYNKLQPDRAIEEAYPWADLKPGSLVVDVGGGVGSAMLVLAKKHSHLRIIVQDNEKVTGDGLQMWSNVFPEAVQSGRVTFQGHDFFKTQNVKDASIFWMRYILHDWSDDDAVKILKELRAAAQPNTVLVILDHLLPYTFRDPNTPPVLGNDAPEPLLPTYGAGNTMGYLEDILMMVLLNGEERKLDNLSALLTRAGWKLQRAQPVEGTTGFYVPVHAVPA